MAANRIQRWALILSGYNYNIKYISSKENQTAGGLSRIPLPYKINRNDSHDGSNVFYIENTLPITSKKIASETKYDKELSKKI